jgi:Ser/Thr protein kinase RdoA (MazF antagonist)
MSRRGTAEVLRSDRENLAPTPGHGLFPVTHSILSAVTVLAEVAQAYPIDTPATCQLLMPGMNDTYLLTARGHRSIIRIYRARWRNLSEIGYELELLNHLAARGVSVSVPIAARDGSLIRPLSAPEGTRYLVLFTYARGTPLSWTEAEHCYRAGRLLATIHVASEDFRSEHRRFRLDLGYLIDAPLAAVRPFLAHRPDDRCYLEAFADRLRARIEAAVQASSDWGVCHGDFSSTGNFHVAEDDTLTVFDFDLCGPGWRAYDLAPIQRAARGYKSSIIWDAFLKGYTETRPLAAADLAAVPLFHTVNRLWSLGMRAGNVAKWGALFMGDWYLDSQLTFFRNWESEHGERK